MLLSNWNACLGNLKDDLDLDEFNDHDSWDRDTVSSISNNFGLELLQLCHKLSLEFLMDDGKMNLINALISITLERVGQALLSL